MTERLQFHFQGYIVKTLYETIHPRRLCTNFLSQIFERMEICFTIYIYTPYVYVCVCVCVCVCTYIYKLETRRRKKKKITEICLLQEVL